MNSNINQNFKRAHAQAWSAVVEDESLPEIKVTVLIQFLFDLFSSDKGKRSDVIEKYIKEYGPVFKTYGKILVEEFSEKAMNDFFENSDREEFKTMAENGVARCLVKSSEKVFAIFAAYFKKEISDEEFLIRMSQTGIGEVGVKIMDAFGIDPSNLSTDPSTLLKLSGPFLAYQGAMGAYREYRKAIDDLQLARESRLQVEAECQRSIEMIRTYRLEAEQRVSKYMNEHLDAFESGFAAMDQAILDNDPDGYIAGNVQIQQILGAKVQFTNQEEFDALMESDEDFIF